MKPSKLLAFFTGVFTALLVLSASIAVPLLCRPFYYAHIQALNLDGYTGLSVEQIREAFDQVMDYCLGLRPDFAAGAPLLSVRSLPLCRCAGTVSAGSVGSGDFPGYTGDFVYHQPP